MESLIPLLIIFFVIILLTPSSKETKKYSNNRCLEIHKWERIEVPEVEASYLECSVCKYKPETEMEEPNKE